MAEWYMASWKDSVCAMRARSSRAFSFVKPPTNALPLPAAVAYLAASAAGTGTSM